VITTAELWEGCALLARPKTQSSDAGGVSLRWGLFSGLDEGICKRFGHLRGSLRKHGQIIGGFDLLIAAYALRHQLTLLTNNPKHFENIVGLQIENR
jgi:tRNA(fMet)-specific endonuclease VapC